MDEQSTRPYRLPASVEVEMKNGDYEIDERGEITETTSADTTAAHLTANSQIFANVPGPGTYQALSDNELVRDVPGLPFETCADVHSDCAIDRLFHVQIGELNNTTYWMLSTEQGCGTMKSLYFEQPSDRLLDCAVRKIPLKTIPDAAFYPGLAKGDLPLNQYKTLMAQVWIKSGGKAPDRPNTMSEKARRAAETRNDKEKRNNAPSSIGLEPASNKRVAVKPNSKRSARPRVRQVLAVDSGTAQSTTSAQNNELEGDGQTTDGYTSHQVRNEVHAGEVHTEPIAVSTHSMLDADDVDDYVPEHERDGSQDYVSEDAASDDQKIDFSNSDEEMIDVSGLDEAFDSKFQGHDRVHYNNTVELRAGLKQEVEAEMMKFRARLQRKFEAKMVKLRAGPQRRFVAKMGEVLHDNDTLRMSLGETYEEMDSLRLETQEEIENVRAEARQVCDTVRREACEEVKQMEQRLETWKTGLAALMT